MRTHAVMLVMRSNLVLVLLTLLAVGCGNKTTDDSPTADGSSDTTASSRDAAAPAIDVRPPADVAPGADAEITLADAAAPMDAAVVDAAVVDAVVVDAASDGAEPQSDDAAADASARAEAAVADASGDVPPSPCGTPQPLYGLVCGCAGDGKLRCDGTCDKPDSSCVPTGQYYALTNSLLGPGRRLDTYSSPTADAFMATQTGYSGQAWAITALGDGLFRLTNLFLGPTRALEVAADGKKLFMGKTGDVPAQKWHIRAAGAGGKQLRIANALFGDARSLDTPAAAPNTPFMAASGDYSGQYWTLTKLP